MLMVAMHAWPLRVSAGDAASGYFRLGDQRIEPRHAIAVQADSTAVPGEMETWVYLSVSAFDAAPVAAAFDPDQGLRAQAVDTPAGSYLKVCINAGGEACGIDFAHRAPTRNFSTGGYGELRLSTQHDDRIAGTLVLDAPMEFFDETYQFDLAFDVAITPAPGIVLPAGGGAPGIAYQAYLTALAQGDFTTLRALAGDDSGSRFPEDDPTSAKETLKSLRDEQPLIARIARGRLDGDQAVLWVTGADRDEIVRSGRVLMKRIDAGWRFEEADLQAIE